MSRIDGEDQLGLSVFTSENGIVYFRIWTKGDNIKMGKNFSINVVITVFVNSLLE